MRKLLSNLFLWLSNHLAQRESGNVPVTVTMAFTPEGWAQLKALGQASGAPDIHYLLAHSLECYEYLVGMYRDGWLVHLVNVEQAKVIELGGLIISEDGNDDDDDHTIPGVYVGNDDTSWN